MAEARMMPIGHAPSLPSLGRAPSRPAEGAPLAERAGAVGLVDIGFTLLRRKGLLAAVAAPLALVGLFAIQLLPERYTGTAEVMVGGNRVQLQNISPLTPPSDVTAMTVESEVPAILSRDVAGRVVDRLGLAGHPEINPEAEGPGLLGRIKGGLGAVVGAPLALLGLGSDGGVGGAIPALTPRDRMINAFLTRVTAEPVTRSQVIGIGFTAEDPRLAGEAATAIAEEYVRWKQDSRQLMADGVSGWLRERMDSLRSDMDKAERNLAEYRARSSMLGGFSPEVIAQQLVGLEDKLTTARADHGALSTQLSRLEQLLEEDGAEAASQVIESRRADDVRNEIALLRQQRGELLQTFGPKHPTVMSLEGKLASAERELTLEASRQAESLRYAVRAAEERSASLGQAIATLKDQGQRRDWANVELQRLDRDAASSRNLYETVLNQLKQTQLLGGTASEAMLLNPAVTPLNPSEPNAKLLTVMALMGSLAAGCGAVFAAEAMRDGILTAADAEALLGLPVLGTVPEVKGTFRPSELVVSKPISVFTEAVRGVQTPLLRNREGSGGLVCMISSAVAGEGKTTFCASIARTAATSGFRVLVVDCDLRCSRLSDELEAPLTAGLAGLLAGEASIEDVVRVDETTGLHVLPAGQKVRLSERLLRSGMVDHLFEQARAYYDLVFIDAPPVLPIADAVVLSRVADRVVVAVTWQKTPAALVRRTIRQLEDAGANVVGIVLNRVNPRWQERYDDRYAGVYNRYGNDRYYVN